MEEFLAKKAENDINDILTLTLVAIYNGKRQIVNTLFLLKENAFPTFCQKGINYFFDLI